MLGLNRTLTSAGGMAWGTKTCLLVDWIFNFSLFGTCEFSHSKFEEPFHGQNARGTGIEGQFLGYES